MMAKNMVLWLYSRDAVVLISEESSVSNYLQTDNFIQL